MRFRVAQFDTFILCYVVVLCANCTFSNVVHSQVERNIDNLNFDPAILGGLENLDMNSSSLSFLGSCIPGKQQDEIQQVVIDCVKSANYSELPGLLDFVSTARKKLSKVKANFTRTGVTEVCKELWGQDPGVGFGQSVNLLDCLLENVHFFEETLVEEVLKRTKT